MGKIFEGNVEINKTAYLNWRTNPNKEILNMVILAEGFMNSSIELCENCLSNNDNKKADILVFPILFNANHGIELYLKALNWTLNKLLSTDNKIEGRHNLQQIFNTVKSKVKTYAGHEGETFFSQLTLELNDYIVELISLIKSQSHKVNFDFPRYPINNNYKNHFYVDELNNVEIDLENFKVVFSKKQANLDYIFSYYYFNKLHKNY